MVIELVVFFSLVVGILGGSSPHGEEYLASLGPDVHIDRNIEEDARLDVIGLLNKYGYPSETHEVQTEDGYLLTMHRITGGKVVQVQKADKPVVFIMHGLLSSSADWVNTGPSAGLGYLLADLGYDVWLGNARGNFYSRKHISLNSDDSKYWKFSWNEIGYYDLPACIDHVLQETGREKIHYIGHSQGTTSFFVMASLRPEYNDKIKSMQAFAPVAYMSKLVSSFVRFLAPMANTIEVLTSLIGVNELLPNSELMTIIGEKFCTVEAPFQPLCSNIMLAICGFTTDLFNDTFIPVILGHTPAGASSKQFVHYAQEHLSAKFRKYDHGIIGNLVNYGSLSPPNYSLKHITAPVALHYSDNDALAHPDDVHQLYTELGNPIGKFRVPHPMFSHVNFLWANNIKSLLYNRVINLMNAFENDI